LVDTIAARVPGNMAIRNVLPSALVHYCRPLSGHVAAIRQPDTAIWYTQLKPKPIPIRSVSPTRTNRTKCR